MAEREFKDSRGVEWRVWDVTTEVIHPKTAAEDFLGELQDGWLVFETKSGEEKRRLCPYPKEWPTFSNEEMEALWQQAKPVTRRRRSQWTEATQRAQPTGGAARKAAAEAETEPQSFETPDGRVWIVALHRPAGGEGEPFLRFTSGDAVLDLESVPDDWHLYSDDQLGHLWLHARPPKSTPPAQPADESRRREDLRP